MPKFYVWRGTRLDDSNPQDNILRVNLVPLPGIAELATRRIEILVTYKYTAVSATGG